MADLMLDLQRLDALHSDLQSVIREFHDAEEFSKDVADATGDDQLADKVRDFASKWNDKRKNMTKSVEALQSAVGAIVENFTNVDKGFAKSLIDNGSGQMVDPSSRSGGRGHQVE